MTVGFSVGIFKGDFNIGLPVTSSQEVKILLSLLETKTLPLLDLAQSLDGLDRLFHDKNMVPLDYTRRHPSDPETLSGYLSQFSFSLIGIVVAWLSGNPNFERIVEAVGEYVKVAKTIADDYKQLVAYLRAHEPSRPKVKTLQ